MVDIVTNENEMLYREAYCKASGHTSECVSETVNLMAKILANCRQQAGDISVSDALANIKIEEFETHLQKILSQKNCECSKNRRDTK